LREQVGMVWYALWKKILQEQVNSTVWSQIRLPDHIRDSGVRMADTQRHRGSSKCLFVCCIRESISATKSGLGVSFVTYESRTSESWVQTVFRLYGLWLSRRPTANFSAFCQYLVVCINIFFVKYSCRLRYVIVQHGLDRIWHIILEKAF